MGTPRSPSCAEIGARRRVRGMRFYRKGMGVKCTVTVIRGYVTPVNAGPVVVGLKEARDRLGGVEFNRLEARKK